MAVVKVFNYGEFRFVRDYSQAVPPCKDCGGTQFEDRGSFDKCLGCNARIPRSKVMKDGKFYDYGKFFGGYRTHY